MGPADTVQETCWERLGESYRRDLLPCFYSCAKCIVSLKCQNNYQAGVDLGGQGWETSAWMNGAEIQVFGHMKPRLRETVTRAVGAEDEAGL